LEYAVHVSRIDTWKKQALEALPQVFGQNQEREEAEQNRLYQQIGKLQVEGRWFRSILASRKILELFL